MTYASNFDNTYDANLIGLWDFLSGKESKDTGLDDGIAQNGVKAGGSFWGGYYQTDGKDDHFDVQGNDDPFDLSAGTVVTQFKMTADPSHCDDFSTVVSRGEAADAHQEGFVEIRVTARGRLAVLHKDNGAVSLLSSGKGLVGKDDLIKVTDSWDAATGTSVLVETLTDHTSFTATSGVKGLTFDITDNDDESFTIGAQEKDDGVYDKHMEGKIDYVAVLDKPVLLAPTGDGVVEGTAGDDLIDSAYTGDPEGDMIDNNDAILPGQGPNDDIVDAGAGNDTIKSGEGDDTVYAGSGNDTVKGGAGNDTIYGDSNLDPDGGGSVREVFKWSDASGYADEKDTAGFTQNTCNVDVTFNVLSTYTEAQVEVET